MRGGIVSTSSGIVDTRLQFQQVWSVTSRERRGQKFRLLSRTAAVDDDVKLICKLSRLRPNRPDYRNSLLQRIAVEIQRQAQVGGQQMLLQLPRRACLNPSHECMLPHPVIQYLLTRIRESVSTTAPDPPQLDCE